MSRIEIYILGAVAAVILLGASIAYIYHKGEVAGSDKIEVGVERATNEAIEKARKEKEAADEKIRTTPRNDVIDRTR